MYQKVFLFYKAPQTWAALIMSSRLVVELAIWSCSSCLVILSLLCMRQGHRFNLPYFLVRIQLHNGPQEKEEDSFIVCTSEQPGLPGFTTCCLVYRNATPTFILQDQNPNGFIYKISRIPGRSCCLISKHFTVQKGTGRRKQTIKFKFGSILKIRWTGIIVKAEING